MQWSDFLTALGLVLILEGILPFLSPSSARRFLEDFALFNDRTFRVIGLICMVLGLVIIYAVRSL